ncbi:peptidylprolyl isomerase [Candidatus Woesearchaeota archaeon]|nr:peptidylprolyl isomerase [Candidatus Woesearchaeota archaeon]
MGKKKLSPDHKPKIIHVYPKEDYAQDAAKNKRKTYMVWGALVVLLIVVLVIWKYNSSPDNSDTILTVSVVTVNGVDITSKDIDAELSKLPKNVVALQDKEQLKSMIVEQMIVKELLLEKAKELKLQVSDAEIDEALKNIKEELSISEDEFNKVLQEQGITLAMVRQTYHDQLLINKVMKQEIQKPIVSDEQIKTYYDENKDKLMQVKASHVLVCYKGAMFCTSERTEADAKARAEEVLKKAKEGKDFAELAKEYSDDNSAAKGGDLGYFTRGQMVKEFEETAFNLSKNQVSGLVKTQFGYHVIKLIDRKTSFDELQEKIKKQLEAQNAEKDILKYIDGLKASAKISYPLK